MESPPFKFQFSRSSCSYFQGGERGGKGLRKRNDAMDESWLKAPHCIGTHRATQTLFPVELRKVVSDNSNSLSEDAMRRTESWASSARVTLSVCDISEQSSLATHSTGMSSRISMDFPPLRGYSAEHINLQEVALISPPG